MERKKWRDELNNGKWDLEQKNQGNRYSKRLKLE